MATASSARGLGIAAVVLMAGCVAQPLARLETTGRDPVNADRDKLACWQEAEAANPLTGSLLGQRALLGYAAYARESYRDEERDRNQHIERTAEARLVSRGYTLRPQ
jgi:hypothetical protein